MEKLKQYISQNGFTYSVVTYGCQMNEHESEKICGMVEELGYKPAQGTDSADFLIFNTCCIRENAEQKIFGNIGALKQKKQQNRQMMIAVCGCMTQREDTAQKLFATFPFVDIVLGTHNLYRLPELVAERMMEKKRVLRVEPLEGGIEENVPVKREGSPLASVNIMYGCNNFCTYCIVPYVRGRERSRDANAVIEEVRTLVAQGYKEVILLGQNVNSYHGAGANGFPDLLRQLCTKTDVGRIRFMTSHPKDLSDDLIAAMRENAQVCKHIHLPVQSGSSVILKKMNRGYTREHYMGLLQKLRDAMPEIVITTDVIVGFPGESEQDFAETMDLLREARFDSAFTFVYSKRSGTKAAEMQDQIPDEVQTERIVELIALQNSITEEKNRAHVGKVEQVLVEGTSTRDEKHICGRTDGSKMVNFEGSHNLIGEFCNVKITEAKRTTLFGQLI